MLTLAEIPGIVVEWDTLDDADPTRPRTLTADLVLIRLRDDSMVGVDWYPECDPSGKFVVQHCPSFGRWNDAAEVLETTDRAEVVACITRLAESVAR